MLKFYNKGQKLIVTFVLVLVLRKTGKRWAKQNNIAVLCYRAGSGDSISQIVDLFGCDTKLDQPI